MSPYIFVSLIIKTLSDRDSFYQGAIHDGIQYVSHWLIFCDGVIEQIALSNLCNSYFRVIINVFQQSKI